MVSGLSQCITEGRFAFVPDIGSAGTQANVCSKRTSDSRPSPSHDEVDEMVVVGWEGVCTPPNQCTHIDTHTYINILFTCVRGV